MQIQIDDCGNAAFPVKPMGVNTAAVMTQVLIWAAWPIYVK